MAGSVLVHALLLLGLSLSHRLVRRPPPAAERPAEEIAYLEFPPLAAAAEGSGEQAGPALSSRAPDPAAGPAARESVLAAAPRPALPAAGMTGSAEQAAGDALRPGFRDGRLYFEPGAPTPARGGPRTIGS